MKIKVGYQTANLDFSLSCGNKLILYSFFDRSSINVRSMAVNSLAYSIFIDHVEYVQPKNIYTKENYGVYRYIERFENGREHVTSALCVSRGINDAFIVTNNENLEEHVYSFLMQKFKLPLMKEWTRFLLQEMLHEQSVKMYTNDDGLIINEACARKINLGFGKVALKDLIVLEFNVTAENLENIVSQGLENKEILITKNPTKKLKFETLDQYYNKYGKGMIANLKSVIKPLVETNGFCKYTATENKRLFPAQGNGVNALVARLEHSKYAICNMDMGTGKTLQALSCVDAYFNKKYMKTHKNTQLSDIFQNNLVSYKAAVICPGHLVDKWVEEAGQIYGMHARAVRTLDDLVKINNNRDKYEGNQLFVFSKDFAKLGDMQGPIPYKEQKKKAGIYYCKDCYCVSKRKVWKGFGKTTCEVCGKKNFEKVTLSYGTGLTCPKCGELLLAKKNMNSPSGVRILTKDDFASKKSINKQCYNCGEMLWGSQVKNINSSSDNYPWVRVTRYSNKSHKTKVSGWMYKKDIDEKARKMGLDEDEYWISPSVGPRRYSPARYIMKHMKGFFDILVADEAHMYESEAAQGQAFLSLIKASKKTIALTGTLSNGYADGLYRMFWRLDPGKMVKNGFTYNSDGENEWNEKYGVLESRKKIEDEKTKYNSTSRGKESDFGFKLKPGISPQLSKDFLLECVVQLQITELSEGLPELNEIVVDVEPENEISEELNRITNFLRDYARQEECPSVNMLALQFQLFYPDMPIIGPIYSPKERDVKIYEPEDLSYLTEGGNLLNKERKLVEIVSKELSEGRNCYVYIEKSGRNTDFFLLQRIKDVIKNVPNAKPLILEASTVSANKREKWLRSKIESGYNVVISNPRLVETGIDFIWNSEGKTYNIPTLIFYQMGLRLDTLWQASRRSYRLIQKKECRTYYMVARNSMQVEILELMAAKQVAVAAIQGGEFSSRGLASMARGVDPKIELARRLKENIHSDTKEIQQMLKSIGEGSSQTWNCSENLLISDILGEINETVEKTEVLIKTVQNICNDDMVEFFGQIKKTKKEAKYNLEGQVDFTSLFLK